MDYSSEPKKRMSLDTIMHCGLAAVMFVAVVVVPSWPGITAIAA